MAGSQDNSAQGIAAFNGPTKGRGGGITLGQEDIKSSALDGFCRSLGECFCHEALIIAYDDGTVCPGFVTIDLS